MSSERFAICISVPAKLTFVGLVRFAMLRHMASSNCRKFAVGILAKKPSIYTRKRIWFETRTIDERTKMHEVEGIELKMG